MCNLEDLESVILQIISSENRILKDEIAALQKQVADLNQVNVELHQQLRQFLGLQNDKLFKDCLLSGNFGKTDNNRGVNDPDLSSDHNPIIIEIGQTNPFELL